MQVILENTELGFDLMTPFSKILKNLELSAINDNLELSP